MGRHSNPSMAHLLLTDWYLRWTRCVMPSIFLRLFFVQLLKTVTNLVYSVYVACTKFTDLLKHDFFLRSLFLLLTTKLIDSIWKTNIYKCMLVIIWNYLQELSQLSCLFSIGFFGIDFNTHLVFAAIYGSCIIGYSEFVAFLSLSVSNASRM